MIGTLRRELFARLLIINEHHLRRVLTEYLLHYNGARPHRTLGQLPPAHAHTRPPQIDVAEHQVRRKQLLGGLTREYQIAGGPPVPQVTATFAYASPTGGTGAALKSFRPCSPRPVRSRDCFRCSGSMGFA